MKPFSEILIDRLTTLRASRNRLCRFMALMRDKNVFEASHQAARVPPVALRPAAARSARHSTGSIVPPCARSAAASRSAVTGDLRAAEVCRERAFTLIELLLVLVILGILAAIVVPKFSGRTEQARLTAAQSQIATFGTALDAFEVDTGSYPKGKNGLVDLVQPPRDAQNWKGPYMKNDIPNDPWGHPYIYECPGKHNPSGYDLMSLGPDGRAGTDDDITSWQQKK